MTGALVAGIGTSVDPDAMIARLERLRLRPEQRICVEAHAGLCLGALEHPVLARSGPFRPFDRAAGGRYLGLLHGRIDNLAEIAGGSQTAAQWALDHWLKGGAEALGAMVGSFVVLVADLHERRLTLVRDPLGDRSVFYTSQGDGWWVASEEPALWPAAGAGLQLDPMRVAEFFGLEYPSPGTTFFNGIGELPPAHWLALRAREAPHSLRYWSFQYQDRVRAMGPAEAAEELAARLANAVRAQAESDQPIAVAVSGGMDSPAIAAVTPRACEARFYTYHTPGFPECDELGYARELAAGLGRPLKSAVCDRHWPLSERFFAPPWLLHEPSADAYRAMRFELVQAALDDGCRIMLTGDFGDHLYGGNHYWLKDLFGTGHWLSGLRFAGLRLLRHGLLGLRADPPLRRIMPLVGIRRARRYARPWLTDAGNALLPPGSREHAFLGPLAELDRIEPCINSLTARTAYLGYLQGLKWGLEMRTPFRDRRLLEFALSLPAHYLFDPQDETTKAVMRRAMSQRLPASILERRGKTSFEPLFRHGLLARHRGLLEELLFENSFWSRFVRADWLAAHLKSNRWDDLSLTVLWNCLAFSLWCRHLDRRIGIDSGAAIG